MNSKLLLDSIKKIYDENDKLKSELLACNNVLNETIDECCDYLLEIKELREEIEKLKKEIRR